MTNGWKSGLRLGLLAATVAATFSMSASAADNMKVLAAASPGGGYDATARSIQTALQKEGLASSVQVDNVPGAAGAVGLSQFIENAKGSGDSMAVIGYGDRQSVVSGRSVLVRVYLGGRRVSQK